MHLMGSTTSRCSVRDGICRLQNSSYAGPEQQPQALLALRSAAAPIREGARLLRSRSMWSGATSSRSCRTVFFI